MNSRPVINFRIDPDVAARLRELASIEDTTVTDLVLRGVDLVLTLPPTMTVAWGELEAKTAMPVWRVGKKLGRTLYRDEEFVGIMDSAELAAQIVAVMNGGWREP